MKKVTVYVRDDQFGFLENLGPSEIPRSEKWRLLLDQLIWAYRKGFCSEHDLKFFRELC